MTREIFVFGVPNTYNEANGAMRYSTASRRWTPLLHMPHVRDFAAAGALGIGNAFRVSSFCADGCGKQIPNWQ